MSKVRDIARRACRHLKGAASSVLDAIAGPTRGAHSAAADSDAQSQASGAHSMRSAHTNRSTRSNSTRSAHSTGLAPRPSTPLSLQTAPAGARGYSMAEVLATVAIIVILCAIVVVNVVSFQANLRQKELDAKAEIIYTAAQEQMTRIMASGRESVLAAPVDDPGDDIICNDVSPQQVRYIPAVNAMPGDATEDNPVEKWQTCYITSKDVNTPGAASNLLFGSGGLEDELLNNNWVIEYDCKSLTVHAVYYSEDYDCTDAENDAGYSNSNYFPYYNANLRNHALRLSSEGYLGDGKHVGYHGGGSSSTNISFDLDPSIQVSNTEKLTATIKCNRPLIVEDLAFLVTLEDSFGNTHQAVYCMYTDEGELRTEYPNIPVCSSNLTNTKVSTNATFKREGLLYTLELTLDSLEKVVEEGKSADALRFTKLYGSQSNPTAGNARLAEGSDIRIKVQVVCKKNPLVETGYAGYSTDVVANSLFDDETVVGDSNASRAGVAGISYGRHLQNLDDGSGVQESIANISSAKQHADIDFSLSISEDTDNRGWASTYGSARTGGASYFHGDSDGKPCFEPISNSRLASYEGKPDAAAASPYGIAHLNVNETGTQPAGLFASITTGTGENPVTLSNIALTGSTVKGTASTGGLVGVNSGALSISNCQLYLSPSIDVTPATDEKTAWLEGNSTGGLVGTNSGSLQIANSSAATVAHGTAGTGGVAGGLVGTNSNSLEITASYADCYLKASKTGGLVGSGSAAVTSSYSAGYLGGTSTSSSAAGLVNGGGSITSSYTACTTYGDHKLADYYRASVSGAHTNVWYLTTAVSATSTHQAGLEPFTDASSAVNLRNSLNGGTGATFTLDQQVKTNPYNLMDQGLDSYTWPTINNVYHYGDWPAGFQAGTLVYFEKYQIGKGSSKRFCYGFEGANVSSTLINASKLENGKKQWVLKSDGTLEEITGSGQDIIVVGDGYGVVYGGDATVATVHVDVLMPEAGKPRSQWTTIASQDIEDGDTSYLVGASQNSTYKIYPLRAKGTGSTAATASITNTTRVNGSSYYLGVNLGSDTYFFNPHFAKTVHRAGADEAPEAPGVKDYIYLRTGRQFHNLSLYYYNNSGEHYRSVTAGRTFYQQRDIAFTDYEWANFTDEGTITSQAPIGMDSDENVKSFNAIYDGACFKITDVSFVTDTGDYVGMFGYVGQGAVIKNVVLCTDYTPASTSAGDMTQNYYVQRSGTVNANDEVHMGVLAGYNKGTITNCATAGYYLAGEDGTVHAYANSTVNIGGLVGTNTGTITDCSADSPKLRLSLYESTTFAAGFVGTNTATGTIKNCYALGAIDVADAKGGKANVAGFAGLNQGIVTGSYCATAIASSGSGTKSYGFAPAGGRVTDCEYLNGGTYSYVNRMYPYNFNTNKNYSAASPIRYGELKAKAVNGAVDGDHSFVHSQTQSSQGNNNYPYRGVVKDAAGAYVHYGNWQDDVVLGTLGIFYWEHEEYGSNNGYHMTYLGSTERQSGDTWTADVQGGTSLCTSHDDGGVITEYGYGVYTQHGQESYTTISWGDIACGSGNSTSLAATDLTSSEYNVAASEALAEQMENTDTTDREYSFFAFTTRTDTDDYLYLNGGTEVNAKQNGTLTLSFQNTDNNGAATTKVTYTYTVSPFFANAMSIDSVAIDDKTAQPPTVNLPSSVNVEASDGSVTDYRVKPGTIISATAEGEKDRNNQYETRSLQQLQYINWRSGSGSTPGVTNDLVTNQNYYQYPYLLYDKNPETSRAVTRLQDVVTDDGIKLRDALRWVQTHDLQQQGGNFTPIAGTSMSSSAGSYVSYMYTWFGGYYNGQSYTIKNVRISSNSFNVGLFGTTVGAKLSNIIMYGDGSSSALIERSASSSDKVGAYALGGLVGVAYDYNLDSPKTIENCAISGYTIRDASGNKQGLGEANVGGLVGVSNTKLYKCSAVTNIELASSHAAGAPTWGIFIRVGGLAGACQSTITDCYTGGSCSIDPSMATETFDFDYSKKYEIYIGGIAGSGFTSNYVNFTAAGGVQDGSPKVYNSYTYFDFPTDTFSGQGDSSYNRLLTMFTIASMSDRWRDPDAGADTSLKAYISNCYYLDTIIRSNNNVKLIYPSIGETNDWRTETDSKVVDGVLVKGPYSRSYAEMSSPSFVSELNNGGDTWDKVTTQDHANVNIDGKFSYPSSEMLEGMNYPFPTVVTQNDLTFGKVDSPVWVHVHYGDWPLEGSFWDKGRDTMDIFSDMSEDGWAYKEFTLNVDRTKFTGTPGVGNFTVDNEGAYANVVDVTPIGDTDSYKVKIRAKKEGTTKICFNGEASATFTLQITANWKLSAEAANDLTAFDSATNTLRIYSSISNTAEVSLMAHDASGAKEYSTSADIKWNDPAPAADVDNTLVLDVTNKNKLTVKRMENGSVVVTVTAKYNYHDGDEGGQTFTQQLFINVEMPSMVGLSNNLTHKSNVTLPSTSINFNEVQLGGDNPNGTDKTYPDGVAKPSPSYSSNSFFLYTEDGDSYLENAANVKSVAVKEQGSAGDAVSLLPGVYDKSKGFYVELNNAVTTDGNFVYLGGTLYYTDTRPSGVLELTVTLQGNYKLTTTVPADWLEKKTAHTVTLQRGDEENSRKWVFTNVSDGTTTLEGYKADDFKKAGTEWVLDGFYTSEGAKVLDGSATVFADVTDISEGMAFKLTSDVTLYAKWKKSQTVWVPATTIEEGERYVITNSKSAGDANVAYQAKDSETAINYYYWGNSEDRGLYLKDDVVTIYSGSLPVFPTGTSGTYIEESFEDADNGYVWKATKLPGTDYCVLANEKYASYYLADNDCQSWEGPWAVVATDEARMHSNSKDARRNAQVDSDSELYFAFNTASRVRFNSGSSYVLAMDEPGDAPNAYLFQEKTYDEYTSTYESTFTLTLVSGGTAIGTKTVSSDTQIKNVVTDLGFSGLPTSSGSWELGWYDDSDYSKATKVLEAGGSVVNGPISDKSAYEVNNGTLTLKENLNLYAIWRQTITNAYVETSSLSNGDYLLFAGNNALTRSNTNTVTSTSNFPQITGSLVDDDGKDYSSVLTNENGLAVWSVSGSSDILIQNQEKILYAQNGDGSIILTGDTKLTWKLDGKKLYMDWKNDKKTDSYYLACSTEGRWTGENKKKDGSTLSFYKKTTVYRITTTNPNS